MNDATKMSVERIGDVVRERVIAETPALVKSMYDSQEDGSALTITITTSQKEGIKVAYAVKLKRAPDVFAIDTQNNGMTFTITQEELGETSQMSLYPVQQE